MSSTDAPGRQTTEEPRAPSTATHRGPSGADWISLAVFIAVFALLAWSIPWMRDSDINRAVIVLVAILIGVVGVVVLFLSADRIVNLLPRKWQDGVRPWVFVGPALALLGVFLVYPALNTMVVSFKDASGANFVGFDNYRFVFTDPAMLRSMRNTALWILVVPAVAVTVGLVFAVLADRLPRGESLAKSLIFLPMAISFVGASVVWGFVYDFKVFGEQTGLLNGILIALGLEPTSWLAHVPWNNFYLMVIMIWMQTGFAMVILSAAVKSVPEDLLEAGRIDGATEVQIFFRIIIPTIMSSIVVVTTTMIINVLKVFDIVWVMGGSAPGTEVIAERMIRAFFRDRNDGRGAAIAVILFLAVVPVMIWNIRRFRAEEEIR